MEGRYFFDTYALIEFVEGSENYSRFSDTPIITSGYNIYELVYFLLREFDRSKAEEVLEKLNCNILEFEQSDIFEAAEFKLDNREQDLSYVDCMGYVLAKKHELRFLTGDQEFRDRENVEYVD